MSLLMAVSLRVSDWVVDRSGVSLTLCLLSWLVDRGCAESLLRTLGFLDWVKRENRNRYLLDELLRLLILMSVQLGTSWCISSRLCRRALGISQTRIWSTKLSS